MTFLSTFEILVKFDILINCLYLCQLLIVLSTFWSKNQLVVPLNCNFAQPSRKEFLVFYKQICFELHNIFIYILKFSWLIMWTSDALTTATVLVLVHQVHCPKRQALTKARFRKRQSLSKARPHKSQFGPKHVFVDPISAQTFIPSLMAQGVDIQFKSAQGGDLAFGPKF